MPASSAPVAHDRRPPGPPAPRGLAEHLRYYATRARDPASLVARRFQQYGDIYYVPGSDHGLFVIRHPDHLRDLLITHAGAYHQPHPLRPRLTRVLAHGLPICDHAEGSRQRRILQPVFARPQLADFAAIMIAETDHTLAGWHAGHPRDLGRDIIATTLRTLHRCLLGHPPDTSPNTDPNTSPDPLTRAILTLHAELTELTELTTLDPFPAWLPTPQRLRSRRALATIDRILFAQIDAQRTDLAPSSDLTSSDLTACSTAPPRPTCSTAPPRPTCSPSSPPPPTPRASAPVWTATSSATSSSPSFSPATTPPPTSSCGP